MKYPSLKKRSGNGVASHRVTLKEGMVWGNLAQQAVTHTDGHMGAALLTTARQVCRACRAGSSYVVFGRIQFVGEVFIDVLVGYFDNLAIIHCPTHITNRAGLDSSDLG
jgi:hypothetical protein